MAVYHHIVAPTVDKDLTVLYHLDRLQVRQLLLAVLMEEYHRTAALMVDKVQTALIPHSLRDPQRQLVAPTVEYRLIVAPTVDKDQIV